METWFCYCRTPFNRVRELCRGPTADQVDILLTKGGEAYEKGDIDGQFADHNFERRIRLRPGLAAAYFNLAIRATSAKKGDFDKEVADYTEAIRLKPDLADAYYGRGLALGKKGDVDRSIATFRTRSA